MRRTVLATAAIGIIIATAGCSSSSSSTTTAGTTSAAPAASTPPPAAAPSPTASTPAAAPNAQAAFTALAGKVTTLKLVKAYTAEDDPNHLLGRPGQYTSKVAFTDSRITGVDSEDADSVMRGGSIEVFATPGDASARAAYLETVTKTMPAFIEYDYVVGTAVLRVSQRLTPDQAKALETALKG